jgi:hypothetical protein
VTFAGLKQALRDKEKEASELNITISELEAKMRLRDNRTSDLEATFQVGCFGHDMLRSSLS